MSDELPQTYVVISTHRVESLENQINGYAERGYICDMLSTSTDTSKKPTRIQYTMIMRLYEEKSPKNKVTAPFHPGVGATPRQ